MIGFHFRAPALFDPSAIPSADLLGALHTAPGMADILAQSLKFVRWLADEMRKSGLDTTGPFIDESGWLLQTSSKSGFVICNVSGGSRGENSLFYMLLSEYGGATGEVGQTVEDILSRSAEIAELEIERD
jgi:hypothetical protein